MALGTVPAIAVAALAAHALYPQSLPTTSVRFAAPGATRSVAYQPALLGATTHFGMVRDLGYNNPALAARQLSQIGANAYRDGLVWGAFSFPAGAAPRLDQRRRVLDFMPVANARPLLVLGLGGVKMAPQGMPFDDQQLGQFAAYTKTIVQLGQRYGAMYEVWNEWNMKVGDARPAFWITGQGNPADPRAAVHYAALAKVAVAAVKSVNPSAKVLVGAVGVDDGWQWTQAMVRYGALEGADGVSVHVYNQCRRDEQRNAPEMIDRLQSLQDMLRRETKRASVPVYVTEFGWPTTATKCAISPERQGYNLAQYLLQSSTLPWLRGSWIYDLKDIGQNPNDIEDNFGIYRPDDSAKPSACFVRESRSIVSAATSVELKNPFPGIYVLRAVLPDRQVAAVWTSNTVPTGHVTLEGQPKAARTMCGQAAGKGALPITPEPILADYPSGGAVTVTVSG
ncbi:hypothetical protein K7957_14535 [Sphingomonas yunnanensis]|uniref:hypothetical protein n=1 Tax=Sphingomonas yunnanensis TaxID=310400 RepID=UPI001CA604BA|nr:hypothetical protein [Sphingomonas yunnanensis]MBY9064156.1 hypothetical protein [Sphingomonas yunnanensis]